MAGGVGGRCRGSVRQHVIAALGDHGRLSRGELAELLDVPKSTITAVTAELLAAGRIAETPARSRGRGSGSGRPANLLTLAAFDGVVAGIDFGHRHVHVALADGHGALVGEAGAELDVDAHAGTALDTAGQLLRQLLADSGHTQADLRATAAGVPGPLDTATCTVQSPTILASWVGLDLPSELRRRIGMDVLIDNDANLGAIGEMTRGAARGYRDFIYVKASNGIGACLVLDGQIYHGSNGAAGEIGHTQLDPDGQWCRCGNRGCLEAVVSMDVVRRQLAAHGVDPLDDDSGDHPVAHKVLAESGRTVGRVLANLCNALNPAAVILGGDLSSTGAAFVQGVRDSIAHLVQPGPGAKVDVLPARLGRRAELIGALAHAANSLRSQQR